MSDLAATNCGCECGCGCASGGNGGSGILWILILLCCCGGGGGFGFAAVEADLTVVIWEIITAAAPAAPLPAVISSGSSFFCASAAMAADSAAKAIFRLPGRQLFGGPFSFLLRFF